MEITAHIERVAVAVIIACGVEDEPIKKLVFAAALIQRKLERPLAVDCSGLSCFRIDQCQRAKIASLSLNDRVLGEPVFQQEEAIMLAYTDFAHGILRTEGCSAGDGNIGLNIPKAAVLGVLIASLATASNKL